MAVLPESMDRLNKEDTSGSLSIIENYINYMAERIEFSMRNVTKSVSAAGVSNAEMYVLLVSLQNTVSALSSTVQGMAGDITSAKSEIGELKESITAAEEAASKAGDTTAALQTALEKLDARVTALENAGKTEGA